MRDKMVGDRIYQSIYRMKVGDEYVFDCDCGNTFTIKHTSRLKNDGKFRCRDCYVLRDSEAFSPEWGFRLAMKRIKNDARRAGRVFEIDIEDFKVISQQPCYYCGSEPNNILTYKSNAGTFVRTFVYGGMDRKDNDIGYVKTNVVPCCIICNRAKNSMNFDEFESWIQRLIERNNNGTSKAKESKAERAGSILHESAHLHRV